MAITRDSRHKRRATGGRRNAFKKKRQYETGRPAAGTKLGEKKIHLVRTMGGNTKHRALHLQEGSFHWGTEAAAQKVKILNVVYNASNNELVRTKTLVKGCYVQVDATPFRKWFEAKYHCEIGAKGSDPVPKAAEEGKKLPSRVIGRHKALEGRLDKRIQEQLATGRILACISSRPGQSGRADGYILEGDELTFAIRNTNKKK